MINKQHLAECRQTDRHTWIALPVLPILLVHNNSPLLHGSNKKMRRNIYAEVRYFKRGGKKVINKDQVFYV